jgi:hypothetical protein
LSVRVFGQQENRVKRKTVTSDLILAQARELHGMPLSRARASELAREVQKLNDAVRDAEHLLDFNDDPARFAATLSRLKGKR